MFDFVPQEYEKLVNIIFLVVTALIARHGITYRKEDGTVDQEKIVTLLNNLYKQNNFKPFQFLYKDGEGSYKVRIFPVFRSKKGDK